MSRQRLPQQIRSCFKLPKCRNVCRGTFCTMTLNRTHLAPKPSNNTHNKAKKALASWASRLKKSAEADVLFKRHHKETTAHPFTHTHTGHSLFLSHSAARKPGHLFPTPAARRNRNIFARKATIAAIAVPSHGPKAWRKRLPPADFRQSRCPALQ